VKIKKRLDGAASNQQNPKERRDARSGTAADAARHLVLEGWSCQARAKASKLEHNSTRAAAVTARNPPDTMS
jgi:hypothetical protein